MWDVDKDVGKFARIDVDSSYPQNWQSYSEFMQSLYPQMFFSVYIYLEDLLGFPRSYYYY